MTDREALFRAILADPDDDTLRLIYADALEEEGDVRRAAFVRTRVQLANVPEYDPANAKLLVKWVDTTVDGAALADATGANLGSITFTLIVFGRKPV